MILQKELIYMTTLVSPGVSISVIDESINVGAGPGTVPLIFIATQQNKTTPDGASLAVGTTKANAGRIWSITSQRDLVQTFGDPIFYSVSGSSLNGYPLNEYGLLAAYSYLGVSNLVRIVRADIDTAELEPTPLAPTSPATVGTYWFDESPAPNGSAYGLFVRSGISPNAVWISVAPNFIYNFPVGSTNPPIASDGIDGNYAVVFQTTTANISYWVKASGVWIQLGTTAPTEVVIQTVWPDFPLVGGPKYWIKTSAAAQGANLVLRRQDATLGQFIQVEAPILDNDAAANTYYSNNPSGSEGQIYIEPVITGVGATADNSFTFKLSSGLTGPWALLGVIKGSESTPTSGPLNGQLWFNALVGLDNVGLSTIDMLVADGAGGWQNMNLPGFTTQTVLPGQPTLYSQSSDPRDNIPAPILAVNDLWVDTDVGPYPSIRYWAGSAWTLISNTDQVTNHGIIFTDARPNPLYHSGSYAGENNGGGTNPDLDPDAPDSDLYPRGFLLWNTRYSTNNVKVWQSPYIANDVVAEPDDTNDGSVGRWVNTSGNDASGNPYMGSAAQKIVIVRGIQSDIISNEPIRAEDIFFNLICAPGFVEAIDEMLVLNEDRKQTAFVLGDTPFTLSATGTALQSWSTNTALSLGNGDNGLVSASKYFAAWYPSGLSTNVDGTDVVVPPTHMALRTIAYNDQVAYPWFAPAGLQRGIVNNAGAVGYVNEEGQFISTRLSEGQRDVLYQNGINPIRVMPQGGIVVFGQKTRQPFASATDRINVVRLENYLRYQLNQLAMPFLFEPNDSTTRKAVKDAFDRFLSELITLRALFDFLVVCDLSNNTPARIDRNELWIDIAIQPIKAIEFIYIPIRIQNTGASLA